MNAGGLGELQAICQVLAQTLTFVDPGDDLDAVPALLRISTATGPNLPTAIDVRPLANVYGTNLISTCRRRKIGRGA